MEIIRIPSAYISQIEYLSMEDSEYILKTIFGIASGNDIKFEKSMRGGLALSIWREAVQMENRARAKKGEKRLNIDIATLSCDTDDTLGCSNRATKSSKIKSSKIKSNQVKSEQEIFSEEKTEEESSEIVKVDKRDFDIDLIIETLKNINGGILDDKIIAQRRYGKLIKDKINKITGFNKFPGSIGEFILYLHENSDQYKKYHFVSMEKFYYNLARIVSGLKKQIEEEQSKPQSVADLKFY